MIRTIYTWFLIFLLVLFIYFASLTFHNIEIRAEDNGYLQKSPIDSRKEVIHSADGDSKGYLQQSPIDPRKTVQYDKDGNVEGTWQKSYIDPRKRIYTPKKK